MTDLEMTKACADAMGIAVHKWGAGTAGECWLISDDYDGNREYKPLHDDAQVMALVKKLRLFIHPRADENGWYVGTFGNDMYITGGDLNPAIVGFVSTMRAAK